MMREAVFSSHDSNHPNMETKMDVLLSAFIVMIMIMIYFLPATIAVARNHKHCAAVVLVKSVKEVQRKGGVKENALRRLQSTPPRFAARIKRELPPMAATNKCLAQSNKSRTGGNATKPQRTFDCKVKDCSDGDFAPAFGLESTVPIVTRPCKGATNQWSQIMKRLLLATVLALVAIAPASAGGLTATITQAKPAHDDNYSILLVVDNGTNQSFKMTEWSCVFYSNNQIVGEDSVHVYNIHEPGKQTAKGTYVKSFKPFDKSECRLTDTR
jgi:hypothetical protein